MHLRGSASALRRRRLRSKRDLAISRNAEANRSPLSPTGLVYRTELPLTPSGDPFPIAWNLPNRPWDWVRVETSVSRHWSESRGARCGSNAHAYVYVQLDILPLNRPAVRRAKLKPWNEFSPKHIHFFLFCASLSFSVKRPSTDGFHVFARGLRNESEAGNTFSR